MIFCVPQDAGALTQRGNLSMSSAKEAARQLIDHLPDQATWDDIMYELYVKQKIEEGLADIEAGRTVPHEQVKAELLRDEDCVSHPRPHRRARAAAVYRAGLTALRTAFHRENISGRGETPRASPPRAASS